MYGSASSGSSSPSDTASKQIIYNGNGTLTYIAGGYQPYSNLCISQIENVNTGDVASIKGYSASMLIILEVS